MNCNLPRLTERDVALLNALVEGYGPSEASGQLQRATRTIKARIHKLRMVLGVRDEAHPSVALAVWWSKLPEVARAGATAVSVEELRTNYQETLAA